MNKNLHIISLLVSNNSGVLARISGLFARRGYNIESLSVCATEDDRYSRMTVTVSGDDAVLEQLIKQLKKQEDVCYICDLGKQDALSRELLLIKLKVSPEKRNQVIEVCSVYKANIIDLSPAAMVLELTGETSKIDGFIDVLADYNILEMARSGASSLHRGSVIIKDFLKGDKQ